MRGAAIGLALGVLAVDAPAEPQLRYDPFRGEAGLSGDATAEDESFSPTLLATLVAGPHSLADLGGRVLRLGESAGGYRLLEVRAFEAVFERQGERVVLPLERSRRTR